MSYWGPTHEENMRQDRMQSEKQRELDKKYGDPYDPVFVNKVRAEQARKQQAKEAEERKQEAIRSQIWERAYQYNKKIETLYCKDNNLPFFPCTFVGERAKEMAFAEWQARTSNFEMDSSTGKLITNPIKHLKERWADIDKWGSP
jgi:curved DNA-binding protein CbpA